MDRPTLRPDDRTGPATVAAVGALLAAAPLYWEPLAEAGVAAAVDWLAAVGVVPPGVYPAGVGGAFLAVGAVLLHHGGDDLPADVAMAAGVAGLALGATTAAVAWTLAAGSLGLDVVLFGLAVGAVGLALPAGAGDDRGERLRTVGLAGALVAPYAVLTTLDALATGGMGGAFTLLSVPLLVVLDALVGYPLYRLGRSQGAPAVASQPGGEETVA